MTQLRLLLFSVLLFSASRAVDKSSSIYNNLYGYERHNLSITETIAKLTIGVLNFLEEGEEALANEHKDSTPEFDEEYDFIVVGAGSAGAVVAARLSEIKDITVLLIEAGGDENFVMDVPALANHLQLSNNINWKYQTESSKTYCRGMKDQKCNWPRGKVMGGSSVLNFMIATRGHPLDYDGWAAMGNDGWAYNEVLKYFKKLENMEVPELRENKNMHNTKGPVNINYPVYHTPLAESFLEAGIEMGYPIIDYNADEHIGFSYLQTNMKNGTRMSANKAYMHPANKRKNLFLSKFSYVNKILINPKSKRAYGVEFTKFDKNIRVRAKKEVILCAGAIGSPQILMLSGVGPTKHLKEINIEVIQDAPVGENLMDHIFYGGLVFLVDRPVSIVTKDLANLLNPYINDFLINKRGPLTVPGGCEAIAFIDIDEQQKLDSFANMELLFIGGSIVADVVVQQNFGIAQEYWELTFSKIFGRHSWMIFPVLMRPQSRGKILLRDKNPKTKPKIFANYLDDPEDVRILIEGIRAAVRVSETKAMQKFGSRLFNVSVPDCENYQYNSNEYWECLVRIFTCTIYHPSGTCKMAPEGDPTGVVNPRLQVKGIKGLRVADASIMPMIVTGHPNIPTIMIGEKLADIVKEDWGYNET